MNNKENKLKNSIFTLTRRTFLVTSGTAALLGACDNNSPSSNYDAGIDADSDIISDIIEEDIFDGDIFDAGDDDADSGDGGVLDPRPVTTITEIVVGDLEETAQFEEFRDRFGKTHKGEGEPYIERDDLNGASSSNGTIAIPSSLAYFAQLTDVHITDEESPARAIHSPVAADSAWRPNESYSLQMLDGAINTINQFSLLREHDFLLFSGDMIDNRLLVEVNSFLDVVEGNLVNPDTGIDDDPRPGNLPDPHDPFDAHGLNSNIPWYICLGNHDKWTIGSIDSQLLADPTGDSATLWISDYVEPTCFDQPPCIDGYCYSETPDRCHMPTNDGYYSSDYVPPDPDRSYLDNFSWMLKIIASTTNGPAGHGLSQENVDSDFTYNSVDNAVPNLPVALITLDTTSSCTATDKSTGDMDSAQLAWLEEQLVFYETENKLVILMSHHPGNEIENVSAEFIALLNEYPNVILHVVGHGHRNKVYPHPAPSGMDPHHGYWEIQTPSLIDWPQQIRFHEIADLGDGTGVIYSTLVDIAIEPDTTPEGSRFYSLLYVNEGIGAMGRGTPEDRNVALRFAWPPDLIPILENLPKREVESLNFIPED
jgi:Calcineurin-like phosphoesterase